MRIGRARNLQILKWVPVFVALVLGIVFINHIKLKASAKDVSSNLTITEAHAYKDDAELQEINETNGIGSGSGAIFKIKMNWKYESETPIENGDTATFFLANDLSTATSRSYTVPAMSSADIMDANGNTIGSWAINGSKKVTITFSGASVGRNTVEGVLTTPRNIWAGRVAREDTVVPLTVGNLTLQLLVFGKNPIGGVSDSGTVAPSSQGNSSINWAVYTPGITINELYRGEGLIALSSTARLSNLIVEDTLSEGATSASVRFFSRATLANKWTTGDGGASGFGFDSNITNLFTKKDQNEGQSYEDFKNNLNEFEYGIYKDENTGRLTVVANMGKQPSRITYEDALRASGSQYTNVGDAYYATSPISGKDSTDFVGKITGNDNVINGAVAFFSLSISENFPKAATQVPVSNTVTLSYDDANGEHKTIQKTGSGALRVGSSISIVKGEAKLLLRDITTLVPISGADVKLQVRNDDGAWRDVSDGAKTTGNDGFVQVLGLEAGKTYRWMQTSYLDHYKTDSFGLYSNQNLTTAISEFVMPENDGVVSYATNEKEAFTVTYTAGEHGDFSDIAFADQYYGTTTPQPSYAQIKAVAGWTFTGWAPSVSNTVTADATYMAQWQRQTKSEAISAIWVDADNEDNIRPDGIKVQLLQNDINYGEPVTVTGVDRWTYTWSGLPAYSEDGLTAYTYSAKSVDSISGYATEVGNAPNGTFTITNTHMPKVSVKVTKVWSDNNNSAGVRPSSIAIKLLADNVDTGKTILLTNSKLTDTFVDLDKYSNLANKTAITYTVSEDAANNYNPPLIAGNVADGFTVTNKIKEATLTVNHYLKGTTTKVADTEASTVYYGASYSTSQKSLANYNYDSVTGTPSGIVSGNITINYYYSHKTGTLTIHHYLKGSTTKVADDETSTVTYGDAYSASEKTLDNYNYDSVSGIKSGTFSGNTAITFYYTHKTGTLTVHHYIKGTTTSVADDETVTKNYGDDYATAYKTNLENYIYDSTSGTASGAFSDNTVVTYYYKLRTGTITTHHYIVNTTTKIANDVTQVKNYTESYTTEPLAVMPAAYANYEPVSITPTGHTGTISGPSVEVIYYYQKKDPNLSSQIAVEAPETVDSKTTPIGYEINYEASIKDYIGDASVNITVTLPYPIDETKSNLVGGSYDHENQAITWTFGEANVNSYTESNAEKIISNKINFTLVYDGAQAKDNLTVIASSEIALDAKSHVAESSDITEVLTPSKIIFRYIDQNGMEIQSEVSEDGFVGDESQNRPVEIVGYRLVANEAIDYTFGEEERVVIYRYVKIENPNTGDTNLLPYFIAMGSMLGLGAGMFIRRKSQRL